jgi:hypothetical protein
VRQVRPHPTTSEGLAVIQPSESQPTEEGRLAPDSTMARRPGYPMEHNPEPVANAHWLVPERQVPRTRVLMDVQRKALTPTFGAEHPPQGLSGVLRAIAYQIPDYRPRHWMLLILADRVDALETDVGRAVRRPRNWFLAAGIAGLLLLVRNRRR